MAYCFQDPNDCLFEKIGTEYYLQIRGNDNVFHVRLDLGYDHFCTFKDDNGGLQSFNDYEYGVLYRCWNEMPNRYEKQYRWEDLEIRTQLSLLKHYRDMIFGLCHESKIDELSEADYFQRAYDKVILYLEQK